MPQPTRTYFDSIMNVLRMWSISGPKMVRENEWMKTNSLERVHPEDDPVFTVLIDIIRGAHPIYHCQLIMWSTSLLFWDWEYYRAAVLLLSSYILIAATLWQKRKNWLISKLKEVLADRYASTGLQWSASGLCLGSVPGGWRVKALSPSIWVRNVQW
jgi:hypothetical protein